MAKFEDEEEEAAVQTELQIPPSFRDPISLNLLYDPVVVVFKAHDDEQSFLVNQSSQAYNRDSLEDYMTRQKKRGKLQRLSRSD